MKKIIISLVLIMVCMPTFTQKFEFKGYGMKSSMGVIYAPFKLIVENTGNGNYKIISYDPSGSISMTAVVSVIISDKDAYKYKGTIKYPNLSKPCLIKTTIKLSDFAKGVGNHYNLNEESIENNYAIKIFTPQVEYGELEEGAVLYPVNQQWMR